MALEAQENPFPYVTMAESANDGSEIADNPAADFRKLFVGEDGLLHLIDSAGTVTTPAQGALSDPMTTRGDMIIRNASNATARLGRGSAGQVLTSDGTDIAWATPGTGAMATDTLWDAAGDLAQGTGANTGAKLSAGTAGQFLKSGGAATANSWASRELDYVQITSPVNITATSEATANTMITGSAVSYDGSTAVIIEYWAPYLTAIASQVRDHIICLYDGSSSIGFFGLYSTPSSASSQRIIPYGAMRLTPSNASHTYSIRAYVSAAGTAVFGAGAGGAAAHPPAFIRITRAV